MGISRSIPEFVGLSASRSFTLQFKFSLIHNSLPRMVFLCFQVCLIFWWIATHHVRSNGLTNWWIWLGVDWYDSLPRFTLLAWVVTLFLTLGSWTSLLQRLYHFMSKQKTILINIVIEHILGNMFGTWIWNDLYMSPHGTSTPNLHTQWW